MRAIGQVFRIGAWLLGLVMFAGPILFVASCNPIGNPFMPSSGRSIARALIEASEGGTKPVSLEAFGDRVCINAYGYDPDEVVDRFPEPRVGHIETYPILTGDGVWLFGVRSKGSRDVNVYSINHGTIMYEWEDHIPASVAIWCLKTLKLRKAADGYAVDILGSEARPGTPKPAKVARYWRRWRLNEAANRPSAPDPVSPTTPRR